MYWIPAFAGMTALLISLAGSPLYAFGKKDVGTSGASFLKIGPGARPAGMGEAFTGVADDIHAIYWNPAGLAKLKHPELTGMHMQWFQDVSYEFAAFAYPTKTRGTWGFAVTNLHTDDIERRTEDTDAAVDTFGSSDNAYWLSYAVPLTERLSIGSNAKYIRLSLDSVHASAFAVDGGITYDTDWHGLRLGSSLQNVGSSVKFINESDPLPLALRFGASVRPVPQKLILSSDIILPRDHEIGWALGGEYRRPISKRLGYSVRTGYRTDSDVTGFAGVSAGGGLDVGRASFDFTWVPFGDLGNSYRYSMHIKFGPSTAGKTDADNILEKSSNDIEPTLSFLND